MELREIPIPQIGEEDVLLRVEAVGICGSDLHQYHGKNSWRVNYPVVLGHEFAGVVAELGSRVYGFREGDRVVSETAAVLPRDSALIRQGLYNLEPERLGFGYGVDGAMATFVKVPGPLPSPCAFFIDSGKCRADRALLRGLQRRLRQFTPASRPKRRRHRSGPYRTALRSHGEAGGRRPSSRHRHRRSMPSVSTSPCRWAPTPSWAHTAKIFRRG